jgi:hypothetical protein
MDPSNISLPIIGGTFPSAVLLGLTTGDTIILTVSLDAVANSGGYISDPASVAISGVPAGVDILSAGGGIYAASPEPASWMMTAAGAVGLLWMGRSRRSAKRALLTEIERRCTGPVSRLRTRLAP